MDARSRHIYLYTSVDFGKVKVDETQVYRKIYFSNRFFGCWILDLLVYFSKACL